MSDDTAAAAEAADPAVLRAERRLRMLEELAQIGMNLARALERQALAAADPVDPAELAGPDAAEASAGRAPKSDTPAGDPSDAFARISRAIRLTLALEARTDEQLRALRAGVAAEAEARRFADCNRAASETAVQRRRRRETVERLVWEAAEREIEDGEALGDVLEALDERLDEDEAYEKLEQAPLRETVERLCADLDLTPDWDLWEGEGWAPKPPFSRSRFSIWSRPSRTPLWPHEVGSHPAEVQTANAPPLE